MQSGSGHRSTSGRDTDGYVCLSNNRFFISEYLKWAWFETRKFPLEVFVILTCLPGVLRVNLFKPEMEPLFFFPWILLEEKIDRFCPTREY